MSTAYRTVSWNPLKRRYDLIAAAVAGLYLLLFVASQAAASPAVTIETLLIRALGSAAFLLLHVILAIGPLSRLSPRFLPLLYNRRHLGVLMCALALAHGLFSVVQFHAFGTLDPLVSLLAAPASGAGVHEAPFELFGAGALLILFLMASTSHDFWLHNLTPRVWKTLHMGVYAAYALIVLHVLFGVALEEVSAALRWALGLGAGAVLGLHLVAGWRERGADRERAPAGREALVDICHVDEIPERRAVTACVGGERVAVFRYDGKLSAVSNVCQHQNGPIGEGRIVQDCIVCPWHGYEYLPDSGTSPPPFTEKLATYGVRIVAGRVLIDPRANPPGTRVEPARMPAPAEPA